MNGTSGFQQDAQKGRPARPQQAKKRCVLCSVRGASEQSENNAGGLFQHPARSAVFYIPITIAYQFLHEQRPQFGTGSSHLFRTHDLIALSTGNTTKEEKVPDILSVVRGRQLLMCTRTVLDDVLSTYWGEEHVFEERSYEMACEFGRFFSTILSRRQFVKASLMLLTALEISDESRV